MLNKLTADLDILARVELEIRLAERRLEDLHTAKRLILELRGSPLTNTQPGAEENATPRPTRVPGIPFTLTDPNLSVAEAVEIVLRRLGRPAGVQEIADRMTEAGYPQRDGPEKLKGVIRATLSRELKGGETFSSERRGVFGLKAWDRAREWSVEKRELPQMDPYESESAADVETSTADEITDRTESMD